MERKETRGNHSQQLVASFQTGGLAAYLTDLCH